MRRLIVRVAVMCMLAVPALLRAQGSRGFVVILGSDTIGVERFVRITLDVHMSLPTPEERFRTFLQNHMLMMHWDRGGSGVKITAQ